MHNSFRYNGLLWVCAGAITLTGCGPEGWAPTASQPADSQPADASQRKTPGPFDPIQRPGDYDEAKAKLALDQIADAPAAPGKPTTRPVTPNDAARRRMDEARRLFGEQRFTETIIEAEKALRYEPQLGEAHRLIALASALSGNESRAKASAEKALSLDPDDLACHYLLGRSAENAGNNEAAMKAYRTALKCPASDTDRSYLALVQHQLGRLLFGMGYYSAAAQQLEAFDETLTALGDKASDNPELATIARSRRTEAIIAAAQARGYLRQDSAAAETLKKAIARGNKDVDLRSEYVRSLARSRRLDAAADEAALLLADTQGSRDALELLIAVHKAAGHPERAIASIKAVVARQPDNADLWLVYAGALVDAGKTTEAIQTLRDLLARHPETPGARWRLVELYRRAGDWTAWSVQLAETVAAQPGMSDQASDELARISADAARDLLKAESAEAPSTQPAESIAVGRAFVRARLLERVGRMDDALAAYDAALKTAPNALPLATGAAQLQLRRCNWKGAIAVLEAAEKKRDQPAAPIEYLFGLAYDGLDQVSDAASHYQKATQLDATYLKATLALGRLYERTRQLKNAARQYDIAISTDPQWMAAREHKIHLLLTQLSSANQEQQQATVRSLLGELNAMQKSAPEDPATLRCAALVQFLFSQERKAYLDKLEEVLTRFPDEQQTREDLVRALLDGRSYNRAEEMTRKVLERDPASAVGHEMMATVLVRLLRFEDAASQYRHMVEMYPNRDNWLRQYGELLMLMRRYQETLALYERMLKLDSVQGNPISTYIYRERMITVLHKSGRFEEARKVVQGWLGDVKEDTLRRYYRGLLLSTDLAANDYGAYLQRVREWLGDEKDPELQQLLIRGLIEADRQEEAVAMAIEWLAESPKDPERLEWTAAVLSLADHNAAAIEITRGLLSSTEKLEERQQQLGKLATYYMSGKRWDQAVLTLKQLIVQAQDAENDAVAVNLQKLLARVHVQSGHPEQSIRVLEKLLVDTSDQLARMMQRLDNAAQQAAAKATPANRKQIAEEVEKARKLAQQAADRRKAEVLRQLSYSFQREGRNEIAEQRLREAMQLSPNDAGICNDLGYTLADGGKDMREAKRMIALAVGEQPEQGAYLDSYGWVLYKLGEFEAARQWLEWAAGLGQPSELWSDQYRVEPPPSEDAVMLDHLGDAEWRTGAKDKAVRNWKRGLEVYDKQVASGDEPAEKDVKQRLERKVKTAQAGQEPPIAPIATTSRPAAEEEKK